MTTGMNMLRFLRGLDVEKFSQVDWCFIVVIILYA